MPEIGPTLRDARMRAKIDIADVEMATKIRARYLRAIENEEWSILPGETFARSFIRTYAEYLGLDGKLLLEEFRRRHERPSDLDLTPIAPPLGGAGQARRSARGAPRGPRPPLGRFALIGVAVVAVLALLLVIGLLGNDDSNAPSPNTTSANAARSAAQRRATRRATASARRRAAARKHSVSTTSVALEVKPTAPVWVCLQDASQKKLIGGVVLSPGGPKQKFTSKSFTATFGNGSVDMVLNGKTIDVPQSANPIGYTITPKGAKPLGESARPTCG
jgi:cytoskeleton protein RodZ